LVKLRYFAGLTIEQAAEILGISPATAKRHWTYARAWLYGRIRSQD
jgi:DNA-directed RNA polymerase specialized sigma24 family protein